MKIKSLSLIMAFLVMIFECYNCEIYLDTNKIGDIDGYTYENWKDNGVTYMTLLGEGRFSCGWNNINNAVFRIGKRWDTTRVWYQYGNFNVKFNVDYRPWGNSYLSVYGWTRDPLIEYYIVESWGDWRPPGVNPIGNYWLDDETYDVYIADKFNAPSIDGDRTFKQFWSVRRSKRTYGTVSVFKHFEQWANRGMYLGKMYEVSLAVEGYQSSGQAYVYENTITVGY
jgi:hypothetical protein